MKQDIVDKLHSQFLKDRSLHNLKIISGPAIPERASW